MRPALLVVDLQEDFLARASLTPPADQLVPRVERLISGCRKLGVPILHVHTIVRPDGTDRMPHWKRKGIRECVADTPGVKPPKELEPRPGDPVFGKRFFSAFGDRCLLPTLEELGVDLLVVAGLYLQGCVRSTVLDAYERGFEVWVAEDATGSNDPLHAKVTREYLSARAASFLPVGKILESLEESRSLLRPSGESVQSVGSVQGEWLPATDHVLWEHRNPSRWEQVLGWVPLASPEEVSVAAVAAGNAQREWRQVSPETKAKLLEAWASNLAERGPDLARMMALEVGKPVALGQDEIRFALALLRVAASLVGREQAWAVCGQDKTYARQCPVGVVGMITPWNNPVAIPVGKLGPALALGNGVVWKAANQAPRTARLVAETLTEAGAPRGLVNLLFGGAATVRQLVLQPEVKGISLTGSCATGREVARLCAPFPKPLQAELGGNNAAVVMPGGDADRAARELTFAAFGFAGQRCTATRRFIVHQALRKRFEEALLSCIHSLQLGDPGDPGTDVGPVISRGKQGMLGKLVEEACREGAVLLCGGKVPAQWDFGCWFEPTLFDARSEPGLRVVQEETFGPVAVLQTARDLAEALELLNGVTQGLAASLYSDDPADQRRFLAEAHCGILKLNQPTLGAAPEAAFSGWKGSGLGPPEHGIWDQEFYTRPQALYGWSKERGL